MNPFGGRQVKVLGDLHAERSEQDPDHEAHVEVEERCKKRGQVTNGKEPLFHSQMLRLSDCDRALQLACQGSQLRNACTFWRMRRRPEGRWWVDFEQRVEIMRDCKISRQLTEK
jgi:hypothetical protein